MSGQYSRDSRERSRRDEPRRSSSSRFDERPSSRMNNPPSRHLWVGNLEQHVRKSTLEDHFYRFGELESVAFPTGRSYAFVNYVREDDAVAAFKSLQGFMVAGLPLKIEFAKSDKSSAPRDDNYSQQRGELPHSSRRSAFSPRESTIRDTSPGGYFPENLRRNDDMDENPSVILWIGFPVILKVDEMILRKAFSPFGEIDKISVFPGRSYAFVQFMNLASAVRAKETLQGKLFGNPRVHISYARNDHASSGAGKRGLGQNIPSPHFQSHGHPGSADSYRPDQNFGNISENPRLRAPHISNMEYGDPDDTSFGRNEPAWERTKSTYEERAFNEREHGAGMHQGVPYHRASGREGSALFHELSPQKLTRKSKYPEHHWDLREDPYFFHEAKKLKTDSFLHDHELPEYPLDIAEHGQNAFPRTVANLHPSDESWPPLAYGRRQDHPVIPNARLTSSLDNWKPSHDTSQSPLSPFSSKSIDWKRNTLELHRSKMEDVWKWEGTIAKGGTPVCRARCFPVGKVMDIILPDFLDCTARTGLDMLAKHYYQATNSWVVFFVAMTDADMGYYNEFMHYLADKQRAAVAKLDERNTLFLVPPSDFSENVLKVPGKLSISGVVLSLEPSSPSTSMASHPPVYETLDRGRPHSSLPLGPPSLASFSSPSMPVNSLPGNVTSTARSFIPAYGHGSGNVSDRAGYSHHSVVKGQPQPQPQISAYGEFYNSSMSSGNNSSLHEHKLPTSSYQFPTEEPTPSGNRVTNQPQNQLRPPTGYAYQTTQSPLDSATSLFSHLQQPVQTDNTQAQNDGEGDPQKRLQATLQLAATLLQQIQQGKGT